VERRVGNCGLLLIGSGDVAPVDPALLGQAGAEGGGPALPPPPGQVRQRAGHLGRRVQGPGRGQAPRAASPRAHRGL
ncbi:MAG: hypothetical protein AVDCRST_MAG10-3196, partial [uncultured Acidimicrobiales bacterium]